MLLVASCSYEEGACPAIARHAVVVHLTDMSSGQGVCAATIDVSVGRLRETVEVMECLDSGESITSVAMSDLDSSATVVVDVRAPGYAPQSQSVFVPYGKCGPVEQTLKLELTPL